MFPSATAENNLEAVTAAEKQTQGDDKDLLAAYVTKLVQNRLKNLVPTPWLSAIDSGGCGCLTSPDASWPA